jgi:hypothetical protein
VKNSFDRVYSKYGQVRPSNNTYMDNRRVFFKSFKSEKGEERTCFRHFCNYVIMQIILR